MHRFTRAIKFVMDDNFYSNFNGFLIVVRSNKYTCFKISPGKDDVKMM